MATFNIDGLAYTDKLPHSRIERLLYEILKKQGSKGGGDDDSKNIVIDDSTDVGNGLSVTNETINIDATDDVNINNKKPITSGAVYSQLELAGNLMTRI